MNAEWIALYVETAKHEQLSDKEQEWLKNALDLAEKLVHVSFGSKEMMLLKK